ncbi:putative phosphotransferase enzyme family protein [Rosellinia necatrix]|uniref:Putative phosphotransferase enzyme family protein n=1 Tax=Rosellinia necatrix TaxID=77044 RepID=A0A1W2TIF0_ROSNE|nr:putative phosphotransferase enzyme family protein [Rosellinia necatrix]
METFPNSSFFREKRAASLPTPAQIRALNEKSGGVVSFDWPPPVQIEALGVFVKYGTCVTETECRTQIWIREKLKGRVSVPEVFGWARDHGQTFIYMSLVSGDPLNQRWPRMTTEERLEICAELKSAVSAWRDLRQDEDTCYIGGLHKKPLTDVFFTLNKQVMGPFQGADAVEKFQDTLDIDVANPGPVVFTHNDLVACNILVERNSAKIAAIIDWGQAGWYPAYWEYCKARRVNVPDERFFNDYEQEWKQEYLPRIISPVDEVKVWYPFLRFAMSKI